MELKFSFVIPVYNRPEETEELLESFTQLKTTQNFEIVIVEDGSTQTSKTVIDRYKSQLNIAYYSKKNTGPGDSRNYGMQKAQGNYYIILDSDCILPPHYLDTVYKSLSKHYVDCFGGPDAAHSSFTNLQKAINFSMTSIWLSKKAFQDSKGFGNIHPGEDPDLSIRLWQLGYKTKLIPEAFVYHKRRISWSKFYTQVNKFGMVRPILNLWHPSTKKITYWFPSLFCLGFIFAALLWFLNIKILFVFYMLYFLVLFITALLSTKSVFVASLALVAVSIQFIGYGYGFLNLPNYLKIIPIQLFLRLKKVMCLNNILY